MFHRPLILVILFRHRQAASFSRFRAALAVILCLGLSSCAPKDRVAPPVDAPLSLGVLGYGVVTVPYTQILDEPDHNGVALGFVREKTVLMVLERRMVKKETPAESWVFVEGTYSGWLPESEITLYDSEGKAQTASAQ